MPHRIILLVGCTREVSAATIVAIQAGASMPTLRGGIDSKVVLASFSVCPSTATATAAAVAVEAERA